MITKMTEARFKEVRDEVFCSSEVVVNIESTESENLWSLWCRASSPASGVSVWLRVLPRLQWIQVWGDGVIHLEVRRDGRF